MLKNYLHVAWRIIIRNKFISFLNIFGLSVAIACCITAFLNYQYSQRFDQFHVQEDHIFRINHFKTVGHERQEWATVPVQLGDVLENELPEVEAAVPLIDAYGTVQIDENIFSERIWFTDSDFFKVFTFPFEQGNSMALAKRNEIILTETQAKKFFGAVDPIGERLTIVFSNNKKRNYMVGAILSEIPAYSSIESQLLLSKEEYMDIFNLKTGDWNKWHNALFIRIDDRADAEDLDSKINEYVSLTNEHNPKWTVDGYYSEPLRDISFNASELYANPLKGNLEKSQVIGPAVMAVLMLLLACFNYVNVAVAHATGRLKEIGVRKTMGSHRTHLIFQFLTENFVLSLCSVIVGLFLAEIFVPAYDNLWPNVSVELRYFDNLHLIFFVVILMALVGLGAGAYPAFYLSSFRPAEVLKGKMKLSGTNPLIRILLSFQFMIAAISVITGFVFKQNIEYQSKQDLGYNVENRLIIPTKNKEAYHLLKNKLEDRPQIKSITYAETVIGSDFWAVNPWHDNRKVEATYFGVGQGYLEKSGIKLKSGRFFDHSLEIDKTESIIVNQRLVDLYGWEEPLGKKLLIDSADYRIIGVVEDFLMRGFWEEINPGILRYKPENYRKMVVEYRSNANADQIASQAWYALFPGKAFPGHYLDQTLAQARLVNNSIMIMSKYLAIIAVVVALLGLFALVSLKLSKRRKEIGIRKIFGAGIKHIVVLLSKEFVPYLLISCVGASLISHYLLTALLNAIFAYYTPVNAGIFITATVILFALAFVIVGFLVVKEMKKNPVESLRYE